MIEQFGCGNKKINRVNLRLTNELNKKLNRVAISCGTKPTTLAADIIEMYLNDPAIVNKLQDELNINPAYKVIPVNKNGEIELILHRDKG